MIFKHGNDFALITNDLAREIHFHLGADITIENPDFSFIQVGILLVGSLHRLQFFPMHVERWHGKTMRIRAWDIRIRQCDPFVFGIHKKSSVVERPKIAHMSTSP